MAQIRKHHKWMSGGGGVLSRAISPFVRFTLLRQRRIAALLTPLSLSLFFCATLGCRGREKENILHSAQSPL